MPYSRNEQPSDKAAQDSAAPKDAVFIYSVPTAVFAFDAGLKLLKRNAVAEPEKAIELLMKGEWLPEELAIIKKAASEGKAAVILGLKATKQGGVGFSQDAKKLELASAAASDDLSNLRELVISFTKKAVAASVGSDNLIIQASSTISDINKTASLLVKRLREWYELYCPEASRNLPVHEEFVNSIIATDKDEFLKKFKVSETMGANLAKSDIRTILSFAESVKGFYEKRKALAEYLASLMNSHCPNVAVVAGVSTGAELLVNAGSLQKLAMLPASTIQLLGAEKELFKHLKDKKERPPKFGVIHGNPLVSSAPRNKQGRAAKLLADKISIAARVDFFRGEFVGDRLLKEVTERLGK